MAEEECSNATGFLCHGLFLKFCMLWVKQEDINEMYQHSLVA